MRAVHVGIGHDDDLVVAQLLEVKFVADARAQRRDDGLQLVVAVDLVGARLFHVQHLAPQRQNRLKTRVAPLCGGAARRVALDDVDLGKRGIAVVAVAQLVRHLAGFESRLAADALTRLFRGLTRAAGQHRLFQNGLADRRILLQKRGELVCDDGRHQRAHRRVSELCLRLALKLRVGQLDRHDGGQTLAHVVAGDLVVGLDDALFEAVGVQHRRQRPLEALLVHAALGRMDIVGKGYDRLVERIVVLQRDFRRLIALSAGHIDDLLMDGRLVAVVPAGKLTNAALIAHRVPALFFRLVRRVDALVGDRDVQPRVQKRLLAHARMQRLIVVFRRVEHQRVGLERHDRAVLVGRTGYAHGLHDLAAREFHLIDPAVAVHRNLQPLGQGVHDRRAHAVQAAGDLVASAAEFAARVQHGVHDLQRGLARLRLNVHGDAAAVVGDGDGIALVDGHGDVPAVARQRFIHGVVHDLIDQMVQTRHTGRADVHAGPLSDRLQPFEHLNLTGVIFGLDNILFQQITHLEAPLWMKTCLCAAWKASFPAPPRYIG